MSSQECTHWSYGLGSCFLRTKQTGAFRSLERPRPPDPSASACGFWPKRSAKAWAVWGGQAAWLHFQEVRWRDGESPGLCFCVQGKVLAGLLAAGCWLTRNAFKQKTRLGSGAQNHGDPGNQGTTRQRGRKNTFV